MSALSLSGSLAEVGSNGGHICLWPDPVRTLAFSCNPHLKNPLWLPLLFADFSLRNELTSSLSKTGTIYTNRDSRSTRSPEYKGSGPEHPGLETLFIAALCLFSVTLRLGLVRDSVHLIDSFVSVAKIYPFQARPAPGTPQRAKRIRNANPNTRWLCLI